MSSFNQDALLFKRILGALDEGQRRWLVGREALRLGRGGIQRMLEVSGLSKPTILKGIKELHSRRALGGDGSRIRRRGGGRKPIEEHDPEVTDLLEQIMEESTVGDPMSPLKWSSKSSYQIQQYLESKGHRMSEDTIQRRLRKSDYSLQANIKDKEGASHAERDRQFRYLNETAKRFLAEGEPVISVDTKKKERVGEFKNPGRKWRKKGEAPRVQIRDFSSLGKGMAIPYGAYDVYRNEGMVNHREVVEDVQYGSSSAAVTIMSTKAGQHDFHGGTYEFLRNTDLNARQFGVLLLPQARYQQPTLLEETVEPVGDVIRTRRRTKGCVMDYARRALLAFFWTFVKHPN